MKISKNIQCSNRMKVYFLAYSYPGRRVVGYHICRAGHYLGGFLKRYISNLLFPILCPAACFCTARHNLFG